MTRNQDEYVCGITIRDIIREAAKTSNQLTEEELEDIIKEIQLSFCWQQYEEISRAINKIVNRGGQNENRS